MFDWTRISADPNNELMRREWIKFYNTEIVHFDLFSRLDRDERVLSELCGISKQKPSKKILDVGFAEHGVEYAKLESWFHRKLRADERNQVFGLDLNSNAVEDIRKLTGYENLVVGDATDTDLIIEEGQFDVIHAGDIIEHLSDTMGFMRFCKNNLKIGGRLVITTPNPACQNNLNFYKEFGILANMEHTCWVTPTNMNELCRRSGLKFAESHYKMNKRSSLKNKIREKKIKKWKDLYFGEFMYVLEREN